MAKKHNDKPTTALAPVSPAVEAVKSSGLTLKTDSEAKVREIGAAFRNAGFMRSDANATAREIMRTLVDGSDSIPETARPEIVARLVANLRAPFGGENGRLVYTGSSESNAAGESVSLFRALTPGGMGDHFVAAVKATLAGETIPARLGAIQRTGRRQGW
jgi:hypothetical protein